jgi:hypothetical protein
MVELPAGGLQTTGDRVCGIAGFDLALVVFDVVSL